MQILFYPPITSSSSTFSVSTTMLSFAYFLLVELGKGEFLLSNFSQGHIVFTFCHFLFNILVIIGIQRQLHISVHIVMYIMCTDSPKYTLFDVTVVIKVKNCGEFLAWDLFELETSVFCCWFLYETFIKF